MKRWVGWAGCFSEADTVKYIYEDDLDGRVTIGGQRVGGGGLGS